MKVKFYHENVSLNLEVLFIPGHNEIISFFDTILKVQVVGENSIELIKLTSEEHFKVLKGEIDPSFILVTINQKDYEKKSQWIKKEIQSSDLQKKIQEAP
jgi:hypothetical protein